MHHRGHSPWVAQTSASRVPQKSPTFDVDGHAPNMNCPRQHPSLVGIHGPNHLGRDPSNDRPGRNVATHHCTRSNHRVRPNHDTRQQNRPSPNEHVVVDGDSAYHVDVRVLLPQDPNTTVVCDEPDACRDRDVTADDDQVGFAAEQAALHPDESADLTNCYPMLRAYSTGSRAIRRRSRSWLIAGEHAKHRYATHRRSHASIEAKRTTRLVPSQPRQHNAPSQ